MNERGKSLYAAVVPADQVDHQAVGQVGATIVYLVMHEDQRWIKADVHRFVEHLINQLFIQGLHPTDLLWTGIGPIPDRDEFAVVDLIAEDVRRAIVERDSKKMQQWHANGFRVGGSTLRSVSKGEIKRANQWRDVCEHTKRVLAPLFQQSRSRSLRRSGRRTP